MLSVHEWKFGCLCGSGHVHREVAQVLHEVEHKLCWVYYLIVGGREKELRERERERDCRLEKKRRGKEELRERAEEWRW